jgi:hypothetical protein
MYLHVASDPAVGNNDRMGLYDWICESCELQVAYIYRYTIIYILQLSIECLVVIYTYFNVGYEVL